MGYGIDFDPWSGPDRQGCSCSGVLSKYCIGSLLSISKNIGWFFGLFEVTGLYSYSSVRITGDDKSAPPSCKLANLTRSCFQWALGGVCGVVLDWLLAEPMKTENRVELTEQHWALGSIAEIM